MKIQVVGNDGFIKKNLIANLKNIRDGKNRTRPNLHIKSVDEFSVENRDNNLVDGKYDFSIYIDSGLEGLPIPDWMTGRVICITNKHLENLDDKHLIIYQVDNLFGKWSEVNNESEIVDICKKIANDETPVLLDPNRTKEYVYIDDLLEDIFDCLEEKSNLDNKHICQVSTKYLSTPLEIYETIISFKRNLKSNIIPAYNDNSLEKKIVATYLSYMNPKDCVIHFEKVDFGGFSEVTFKKQFGDGQLSANISFPSIVKGEHWHNTKWEIFMVVSGEGQIHMRKFGTDTIYTFDLDDRQENVVIIPPGYTHNLINTSSTKKLTTVIWANEVFDELHPDTFREPVCRKD